MTLFRQGDLDGLCGVYALINAVEIISPRPEAHVETLMKACIHALYIRNGTPFFFLQGIGLHEMIHLLRMVVRPNFSIRYKRPFARNAGVSLTAYWDACRVFLDEDGRTVITVLASNNIQHWTVVAAMSDRCLFLMDSDGLNRVKRTEITVRPGKVKRLFRVFPAQTFFLFKAKG